jgi:hypothetical protein
VDALLHRPGQMGANEPETGKCWTGWIAMIQLITAFWCNFLNAVDSKLVANIEARFRSIELWGKSKEVKDLK